MLQQAGRVVTIGALCCAIGLHWVALQSIAWGGMLVQNARHAPLCEAIAQTFDGAHPCSLCHMVAKGKAAEKESHLQSPAPKVDLICITRTTRLMSPLLPFEYASRVFAVSEIGQSPPVPPPRLLLS